MLNLYIYFSTVEVSLVVSPTVENQHQTAAAVIHTSKLTIEIQPVRIHYTNHYVSIQISYLILL